MGAGGFWEDVWTNVFASALYTAILALGIVCISALLLRKQRKRLFRVLSLDDRAPVLRIFVSRLDVLPAGSQGTDGRLAVGFVGPALMQLEYQGGREVCRLLEEPFLDILPDAARRLLEGRGRYLADVDVHIDVSPARDGGQTLLENGRDSIVLLGTDVYSPVVRDIYRQSTSFVKVVSEATGEDFDASSPDDGDPTFAVRLDGKWHSLEGRAAGREVGTIQRVTLASGRRVLMCAGLSASTTSGSARHFAKHWKALDEQFGDDDFLVVLAFTGQQADSPILQEPDRLLDFERRRPVPRA